MHRITGDGFIEIGGKRFFIDQSLPGTPGTVVDDGWMNAVQEEIANCIELNGGTLATDPTQDETNGRRQLYEIIFNALKIGSSALSSNAVTTSKIANGSVTGPKIASDSIVTSQIIDEAVTEEKLSLLLKKYTPNFQGVTIEMLDGDDNLTGDSYQGDFKVINIRGVFHCYFNGFPATSIPSGWQKIRLDISGLIGFNPIDGLRVSYPPKIAQTDYMPILYIDGQYLIIDYLIEDASGTYQIGALINNYLFSLV